MVSTRDCAATVLGALVLLILGTGAAAAQAPRTFLSALAFSPSLSVSTVPANGDQNPYGVAVAPPGFPDEGVLHSGDVLVSNFNNGANQQGRGTTIVAIRRRGQVSTFFTAPPSLAPVGLTTALVALRSGVVVVGNTPTTDGTAGTASAGSLIFLDSRGELLANFSHPALQGPRQPGALRQHGLERDRCSARPPCWK